MAHVGDYGCLNGRQQKVGVEKICLIDKLEKDIEECTIERDNLADEQLTWAVKCARLEEDLASAIAEHDKTEKKYNICSNERDRMIKECIDERKRMAYERCCERDRMYEQRCEEDVDEEEGGENEGEIEDEEIEDEENDEEEKDACNKCIAEPLFCLPIGFTLPECAICFDEIQMVNITVTTCGHTFHSSCVFKALDRSDGCPLCRNQLVSSASIDSDSDSDSGSGSEEDEEREDEEEEEEEIFKVDLEQLATKMTNMGYTISDLLKLYVPSIKTVSEKYTDAFVYKIGTDIDDVLDGAISLVHRDTRSYAAVTET
jgi:hypothetical protein